MSFWSRAVPPCTLRLSSPMLAVVGSSFALAFFSEYIAVNMERRGFLALFMISMDSVEAEGYLER